MKTKSSLSVMMIFCAASAFAQADNYAINTLFSAGKARSSGGYGAVSNKFTKINGQYANIAEVYGGWYINHRFLLGLAAAGVTNDLPVKAQFSADPAKTLSYAYGHAGLMSEYVLHSEKTFHLAFQMFAGAGYTTQYERHRPDEYWSHEYNSETHDGDWFFVAEPGISLEMNVFRWMRFSPGISYRAAFNADGQGLSDNSLSAMSYNLTLKFGKF